MAASALPYDDLLALCIGALQRGKSMLVEAAMTGDVDQLACLLRRLACAEGGPTEAAQRQCREAFLMAAHTGNAGALSVLLQASPTSRMVRQGHAWQDFVAHPAWLGLATQASAVACTLPPCSSC